MIIDQKKRKYKTSQTFDSNTWFLQERLQLLHSETRKQRFAIFAAHFIYQALFITFLVLGIINAYKTQNQAVYQTWYTYIIVAVLIFVYYNFWIYIKTYQLHYRLKAVFSSLKYNAKEYNKLIKLDWFVTFLPISSLLYKTLVLENHLIPQNKNINALQDLTNIRYLINLTSNSKFTKVIQDEFTFSVQDLTMSSVLLGLFLIITTLTKFTGLSKVGLSFEYVFYIIFALFFSTFKASLLGLIADFASLLFTGGIWSWFWMYAIVPVAVVLIAKAFLWMYKANTKVASLVTTIILVIIFVALLSATAYAAYLHNIDPDSGILKNFFGIDKKNGNATGWRITRTFGVSTLSDAVIWSMVALSGAFLAVAITLTAIIWIKMRHLSQEQFNLVPKLVFVKKLLISFGLVISVIVIARWIYGPYVYIKYMNYFNGKNYLLEDKYIYFMIPIVLRSFISIPIYTVLLITIYSTLDYFDQRVLKQKRKITY
ncbi:hypothetical protein ACNQ1X_01925 [Mycoplasma sp. SK341A]|uniref:hypothetical protein n=1 Tax=unclassified Mycoplasma TaxID=2683645 RepID=UPI003A86E738